MPRSPTRIINFFQDVWHKVSQIWNHRFGGSIARWFLSFHGAGHGFCHILWVSSDRAEQVAENDVFFLGSGEGFSKNWHIFSLNFFKNLRADVWTFPCPQMYPLRNLNIATVTCRIPLELDPGSGFVHHQQLAATSSKPTKHQLWKNQQLCRVTIFFSKPLKDYNVKDLTKIYKGPEVLMNCPSLGLEPWGLGPEIPRIFRGKQVGNVVTSSSQK